MEKYESPEEKRDRQKLQIATYQRYVEPYFKRLTEINNLKPFKGKVLVSENTDNIELIKIEQDDNPEEIEIKKNIKELQEKYLTE